MKATHRAERGGVRRPRRPVARWSTGLAALAVTGISIGGRLALDVDKAGDSGHRGEGVAVALVQPSRSPTATTTAPPDAKRPKPNTGAGKEPHLSVTLPESATGRFTVAAGGSPVVGSGELITYTVEVEEGLPMKPVAVARIVDRVLAHGRGWTAVEHRSFQRVKTNPAIHIRLASARTTDELCAPLDTGGRLSCRNGADVVLNAWRWVHGADAYARDPASYRWYMVNHEFGHALGYAHAPCPAAGEPAPVMLQQTKGLSGCMANPWPGVTG